LSLAVLTLWVAVARDGLIDRKDALFLVACSIAVSGGMAAWLQRGRGAFWAIGALLVHAVPLAWVSLHYVGIVGRRICAHFRPRGDSRLGQLAADRHVTRLGQ
jgi:hypothetical protein